MPALSGADSRSLMYRDGLHNPASQRGLSTTSFEEIRSTWQWTALVAQLRPSHSLPSTYPHRTYPPNADTPPPSIPAGLPSLCSGPSYPSSLTSKCLILSLTFSNPTCTLPPPPLLPPNPYLNRAHPPLQWPRLSQLLDLRVPEPRQVGDGHGGVGAPPRGGLRALHLGRVHLRVVLPARMTIWSGQWSVDRRCQTRRWQWSVDRG